MKRYFSLLLYCLFAVAAFAQKDYAVKFMDIRSQQQELKAAYIYQQAPQSNGNTIVLLHGKNFSGTYWSKTIAALLSKGYNVLAPDQIGFGRSSKPQQYQFTFQQLAVNTNC